MILAVVTVMTVALAMMVILTLAFVFKLRYIVRIERRVDENDAELKELRAPELRTK